jgi:hypothetical protein
MYDRFEIAGDEDPFDNRLMGYDDDLRDEYEASQGIGAKAKAAKARKKGKKIRRLLETHVSEKKLTRDEAVMALRKARRMIRLLQRRRALMRKLLRKHKLLRKLPPPPPPLRLRKPPKRVRSRSIVAPGRPGARLRV